MNVTSHFDDAATDPAGSTSVIATLVLPCSAGSDGRSSHANSGNSRGTALRQSESVCNSQQHTTASCNWSSSLIVQQQLVAYLVAAGHAGSAARRAHPLVYSTAQLPIGSSPPTRHRCARLCSQVSVALLREANYRHRLSCRHKKQATVAHALHILNQTNMVTSKHDDK